MLLTEEEARTKRCCGGNGCGTYIAARAAQICVASECMAWRWGFKKNPDYDPSHSHLEPGSPQRDTLPHLPDLERGSCGLARQPYHDRPPLRTHLRANLHSTARSAT